MSSINNFFNTSDSNQLTQEEVNANKRKKPLTQEELNEFYANKIKDNRQAKDDPQPIPDGEFHVLLKSKKFYEEIDKNGIEYLFLIASWKIIHGEHKGTIFNVKQNLFSWIIEKTKLIFESNIPIEFFEPLGNRFFVGKIKVKKNAFKNYDIVSMEPFKQIESIENFMPLDSIDDIGKESHV